MDSESVPILGNNIDKKEVCVAIFFCFCIEIVRKFKLFGSEHL